MPTLHLLRPWPACLPPPVRALALAWAAAMAACVPAASPPAAYHPDAATAPDAAGPADSVAEIAATPTPTCASPFIDLATDSTRLLAPPLQTRITASGGGADITAMCHWTAGPSSVCRLGAAPGSVRAVGPGICTVVCALDNGACGQFSVESKPQTLLYVLGGEVTAFPPPPTGAADGARIQRLRTQDGQWDATVAFLPEFRVQPAAAIHAGQLWVFGGETGGAYQAAEYWDAFFPTCPEAIVTPTQIKAEIGCRAVRRLDLASGQWDSPGTWLHPRSGAGAAQFGSKLFLLGGHRAKTVTDPPLPELLAVADLAGNGVKPLAPAVPVELLNAFASLPWPALQGAVHNGQLLVFAAAKTWQFAADGGAVAAVDIGWPCPEATPRQVLARHGAGGDELWVVAGEEAAANPACALCGVTRAGADGKPRPWCQPQRRVGEAWAAGIASPPGTWVSAEDGLYVLGDDATWRLAPAADQWQPIGPPLPYGRSGFAAVAVTQ